MTTGLEHTILYVDDERANRIVFEQSFNQKFRIRSVSSGQEALEVLKTESVGVLVTDQRMGEMSGNDLLMRTRELYPDIIRVVITAYSDLDPILRAVNDGLVARYIVKPWNRTELEQILTWATEAFSLGQNNSELQLRLMQTERLVTLGSIGAAVIHDLNQPLCYLTSNSERLKQLSESASVLKQLVEQHGRGLDPIHRQRLVDLSDELPDIVRDMVSGCNVMQELTSSIRKLLRPAQKETTRAIDPLPIIRYAVSVCRGIALSARGSLMYDGPAQLPHVRIGYTELTQILINLVANGAQAISRAGKTGCKVILHAAPQGDVVRFTVTDNGPGMSEEVLAKVGTPFFSTRSEGTGLGLAQCRRLIERENGEFSIQSKLGEGTTVSFTVALGTAGSA